MKKHSTTVIVTAAAAAAIPLLTSAWAHGATVAEYRFDTMADSNDTIAGERLFDSSSNALHLTKHTLGNGTFRLSSDLPTVAPAGSLTLNNNGSPFVDAPSSNRFSIGQTGELSVEFWWKPERAQTVSYIVQFPGAGASFRNSWGLYQGVPDESNKFAVRAFMYDSGPSAASFPELSTGNIFDTDGFNAINPQWHHIALTMDGTKTGRLYLDGNLVSSHSYAAANYTAQSGALRLGADVNGNFGGGFQIDDLRISDAALPAGTGSGVNQLAFNASLSQAPNPGPRPAKLGEIWVRQRPMVISSWGIGDEDMPLFVGTGINHALNNRSGYNTAAPFIDAQMLGSMLGFDDSVRTEIHIASNAPRLTSYMIRDEIPPQEIADIAQQAAYIRSIDSSRIIIAGLGSSGHSYIDDVMTQIQPDAVIHGFYPFQGATPATDEFANFLTDHQSVRVKALEYDVPYFAFIQSFSDMVAQPNGPDDSRRLPSESELRAQMFSLLAGGVKGFTYFVVDSRNGGETVDNALIDREGNPSTLYAPAAAANAEVARLGEALRYLDSTDWRFVSGGVSTVPELMSAWSAGAGGDTKMTGVAVNGTPADKKDAVVGFFTDDAGQRHFMLTNLFHAEQGSATDTSSSFTVSFDDDTNHLLRLDRGTGGLQLLLLEDHTLNLTLPGGTGDLFKYDLAPFAGVTTPTWNAPGAAGGWSTSGSWLNGNIPDAVGAIANFNTLGSPKTVTVDGNKTAGFMFFNSADPYTVSGASSVTLDVASGAAGIGVLQGSHTISAPLTLADNTLISVSPSASINIAEQMTASPGVKLIKEGGGTLRVKNVRAAELAVNAGTVMVNAGGGSGGTSKVNALSVGATAKLDIGDNKLIVANGTVGTASAGTYSGLTGLIQSAHNGGAWDGNGITTSMPDAAGGLTALAIATADQAGYAGSTFGGVSVAGDDVLVMYTYAGDANLDGLISGDDYSVIDFNIAVPGASGWSNGDFNYDGIISGDDYSVIDFNIAAQGTPFPTIGTAESAGLGGLTAVPEPGAGCGVLAAFAATALRRRRRRVE